MENESLPFTVDSRSYSRGNALLIAEIGTGHRTDLGRASELIAAAKEAGADCVKFQTVFAGEIIHPKTGRVPLPGGEIPLYERFRALEAGEEFYSALMEKAEASGLLFLSTPFGIGSAKLLRRLDVKMMKVASPELNHVVLLGEIASYRLPTLLSTGVSLLSDIERAVDIFIRCDSPTLKGWENSLAILHCVTAYPAPPEEYNLTLLRNLSGIFGLPCGVSDHSLDPILVPGLALACGAAIVEKHFTLSKADGGLDDPIALDPAGFSEMAKALRRFERMSAAEIAEEIGDEYGGDRVRTILGSGLKRLAPSEEANYSRTNRSLHAVRAIKKGESFDKGNVAALRTEKVLRPGIEPIYEDIILGRLAAGDIPEGEGIRWIDVGGFEA